MFDKTGSTLIAAVAAIIFSATMIGAAVGPAHAVETTPAAYAALSIDGPAGVRG